MQKILTRREKSILCLILGIVAFGLGFNFIIGPILNRFESLNKEIEFSRAKLSRQLKLLSQKDKIQKKYGKFSFGAKPSGQQQDAYLTALTELENLVKAANIRIVDIRPQKITLGRAGGYNETLVDLKTEGTMEEYLKFIYDLENSLLLLRIKRLQLTAKSNNAQLEGTFSISQIFYAD